MTTQHGDGHRRVRSAVAQIAGSRVVEADVLAGGFTERWY